MSRVDGLAIDFGGTKISAARVVDGKVKDYLKIETDGDAAIEMQVAHILKLLHQLDIVEADKVGIAVAGKITSEGVWQALNTKTLTKVNQIKFKELLQDKLSRPVVVQNDAIAALVGEYSIGAASGYQRSAFITVSTGVGGGIILDGKPIISPNGLAGHVGFTTSRITGYPCGSGRVQTIESIASGNALASIAQKQGYNVADGKAVFEAHLIGKKWANIIVQQSANAIAELCTNLNVILGLDIIVIGGSIGLAQGYLDMVKQALDQEPKLLRPKLTRTSLGCYGALIGVLTDEIHV